MDGGCADGLRRDVCFCASRFWDLRLVVWVMEGRAMHVPQQVDQDALAIGDWWAPCCVHDLEQIQTAEELAFARTMVPYAGGWHSLREALAELLNSRHYMDQAELDEEIEYARQTFPEAFVDGLEQLLAE